MKRPIDFLKCYKLPLASLFLLAIVAGSMTAAQADEPPAVAPKSVPKNSVYVKILLPKKEPAKDKHPVVESWITEALEKNRARPELRAVTDWIQLPAVGEKVTRLWDATLDGAQWGCPACGGVELWTDDGKVSISLSGWSLVVPEIIGTTLAAEVGSRGIAEVNYSTGHEAFVAILVGPPQPKKEVEKKDPEKKEAK
jgi:hypothetical protein